MIQRYNASFPRTLLPPPLHSKSMLLKRLYVLLEYLPPNARLLYRDTYDAHSLVKPNFEDDYDYNENQKNLIFTPFLTNILKKENKINKILRDNFSKTSLVGKKTLCNKKSTLSPLKNLTSMFTDQICMTEKSN